MQNGDEEAPDQSSGRSPRLRPGKNPATIGAIGTVLAAVIAGVFTLIATHQSSNANSASSVNILPSLSSGSSGVVAAGGSGGGGGGRFLADMTALNGPDDNDISDTVGGRAITKTLGVAVGGNATYNIPVDAKTFLASVGMSDTLQNGPPAADSRGVFGIWGDTTLLKQLNLSAGQLAVVSVPVAGYKILRLTFTGPSLSEGDFGLARFAS
jgi:hypothetical protein